MIEQLVYGIRSEELTNVFMLFPFLASDYFYITFIALGYWLRPTNKTFTSLGFLIPFSTLLNCLLKNAFRILRPDSAFHLILVKDNIFGFPSGDVQVATVFWIFISFNKPFLRYIGILLITGIGFSRIYLGVHSIWDVLGGTGFGLITLYLWDLYGERRILSKSQHAFWIFFISTAVIYGVISSDLRSPVVVPVALGCLIGFGLSLNWINNEAPKQQYQMNFSYSILALLLTITMLQIIPVMKQSNLTIFLSLVLKYALLVFNIFVLTPVLIQKISHRSIGIRFNNNRADKK
ncbi:hypothetical protein phytr_4290 [Candidatus Phycorickettsia trachydisci]|uniref:Phosphatidic acid phosphatase type 2/haloperoxidase domain-containing protein n=1 Tax=Candidatus Phycorickettsia trachydisci TaxID=2115978 RepID=A0A2P1P7X7_9RICK|nr:phosphatase PAP2 family protein [Candidatus Phycorickettsia trachydisci]AVP87379.1 hypothetical protein phytr_4290 [Candidatus Phycorickettsia trachydisci]